MKEITNYEFTPIKAIAECDIHEGKSCIQDCVLVVDNSKDFDYGTILFETLGNVESYDNINDFFEDNESCSCFFQDAESGIYYCGCYDQDEIDELPKHKWFGDTVIE